MIPIRQVIVGTSPRSSFALPAGYPKADGTAAGVYVKSDSSRASSQWMPGLIRKSKLG